MRTLSRRQTLALGAGSAAFTMTVELQPLAATPKQAQAEIAKFTGGKAAAKGKISIDLPEIAENGNTVPLAIAVASPMTAEDHVTELLVVADDNPFPKLVTFHFTPMSGRAEASTRVRLAATENVIVVAKTSTGNFFTEQKQVKVTIGGCGG